MPTDTLANDLTAQLGGWSNDPKDWVGTVKTAAQKNGIPPETLWGVIQAESGGDPGSDNGVAQGLTQFTPSTFQSVSPKGNVWKPEDAINATALHLKQLRDANGGDLTLALKQYQGGTDQTKWGPKNAAYPGQVTAGAKGWDKVAASAPEPPDELSESLLGQLNPDYGKPALADRGEQVQGGVPAASGAPVAAAVTPAPVVPNAPVGPVAASPPAPQVPAPGPASPYGPPTQAETLGLPPRTWGTSDELANATTLGLGPRLLAGTRALGQNLSQGTPIGEAYNALRGQDAQAQRLYSQDNPGASALIDTLGPVVPTMAGMGAVGAGAQLAGRGVAAVVPTLAPAVEGLGNVFAGTSALPTAAGRVATSAGVNAVKGGIAGAMGSGLSPDSTLSQAATGAVAGGTLGPILDKLGNVLTPRMDPSVAAIAQNAQAHGVDLPIKSLIPGSGLANLDHGATSGTMSDYTRAIGRQIGLDSPTLTQAELGQARLAAGQDLNTLRGQITIAPDTQLAQDIVGIAQSMRTGLAPLTNAIPQIKQGIRSITTAASTGQITGAQYLSMTGKGGVLKNMIDSNDPNQQTYGGMLKDALDSAIDRQAPAGMMDSITDAKRRYAIAKGLEPAVANAQNGILTPANVTAAFKNSPGQQMKDLADIGKFLPRPDQTGAPRQGVGGVLMNNALPLIAAGAAGGLGTFGGASGLVSTAGAALSGLAGMGVKHLAGSYASSPTVKNALMDMALNGGRRTSALGQIAGQLPMVPITALTRAYSTPQ